VDFEESKKKYGTYFAFHGSSMENWHAILRQGLRNLSGTDLQRNGAAYGSGVYMAKDSSTSFGYSRVGRSWSNSKFGTSTLLCLAIAEVAKAPGVPTTANPYYVVADDRQIMTRFFLFYPGAGNARIDAVSLNLHSYFDEPAPKK
jgi:poly [ADP-ribose] polymerase 6/8